MKSRIRNLDIALVVVLAAVMLVAGAVQAQSPSAGLVPVARVGIPNLSPTSAKIMPPAFTATVLGQDADSPSLRPARWRALVVSAQYDTTALGEPLYIRTPLEYEQHGSELISWDDANWSDWDDYPQEGLEPQISFSAFEDQVYYLLVFQVMDADGAVSVDLGYQQDVMNFLVREGYYRPQVTLCEPFLGCTTSTSYYNEIASGQPLNFSWIGDASAYGGTIVSYRHGWDLMDPNDPNDPGWAVPPGLAAINLFDQERFFNDGLHTFYLRVVDDAGQVALLNWQLRVIPYVDRAFQLPLLVIDQTVDSFSNKWPDQGGNPRDNEDYRNPYWEFLADASGGVDGFDWQRDWMDHTQQVDYADLVQYQAVICYARATANQTMFQQFRPSGDIDRYVWLTPYQYRGGNYFQVGGKSMDSYLEIQPNYMIPIIFEAPETILVINGDPYIVGFGQKEMPDGSLVPRGPLMYPYATAGIAALDWTSPSDKYIYGRIEAARNDRDVECVGLKGLALDPAFKANHSVGPGALADTFFTDNTIDWQDALAAAADSVNLFNSSFPFRDDEFVDINISSRAYPVVLQECPSIPQAPGGMCVEPMYKGISRMDWIREYKWSRGDPSWPNSEYSPYELEQGCGVLGLTAYQGVPSASSRTNGHTYGYFSYKMAADKPAAAADVYWGFDPYRFDQTETKKAIRWVLDYFGLNIRP